MNAITKVDNGVKSIKQNISMIGFIMADEMTQKSSAIADVPMTHEEILSEAKRIVKRKGYLGCKPVSIGDKYTDNEGNEKVSARNGFVYVGVNKTRNEQYRSFWTLVSKETQKARLVKRLARLE